MSRKREEKWRMNERAWKRDCAGVALFAWVDQSWNRANCCTPAWRPANSHSQRTGKGNTIACVCVCVCVCECVVCSLCVLLSPGLPQVSALCTRQIKEKGRVWWVINCACYGVICHSFSHSLTASSPVFPPLMVDNKVPLQIFSFSFTHLKKDEKS